ncbi:MAG: radical SAM protein [Candidatus Omnitrophota bacterium]|nr:MAG: radical SAM protein [Candidatus Omnitrophota bacterium]
MHLPFLVFSDKNGKIYSHPSLRMAAAHLHASTVPKESELIRLPQGSTFFHLPGRIPLGFNHRTQQFEPVFEFQGKEIYAVGAFLIPAYLRLYTPATVIKRRKILPLWAYTAVGFYGDSFYVTAKRIDNRIRQSPRFYDARRIKNKVRIFLKKYPKNRLYKHLANCALNYNCLAAKNLFLGRWEAPLPTARVCNARCIGCLSFQEAECLPSHQRIHFKPNVSEIVQVMENHLKGAKEAIVSFGQGCEGEPLLEVDTIAPSIEQVRRKIQRGTINMNTNASIPKNIEILCKAGIDSFRVSLNSAQRTLYKLYFRPRNYTFRDVLKSIEIAKKYRKFVSVNLFVSPGLSDSVKEIKALIQFIRQTGVDMIQWRNLNIDPDYYLQSLPQSNIQSKGVLYLVEVIKKEFPQLKMGYFNLPKEKF